MHASIPFQMTQADYRRFRRAYRAMVAIAADHDQTLHLMGVAYVQTLEHRRQQAIYSSQRETARYLTRAEGR